jgi:predicted amidohydrolase YtcJ
MAIKDDRFMYVGSDAGARKYVGNKTAVVDLKLKTVLPGLIDSHIHFSAIGELKKKLDVYWKPKEEILELVAGDYQKAKSYLMKLASTKEETRDQDKVYYLLGWVAYREERFDEAISQFRTLLEFVPPQFLWG